MNNAASKPSPEAKFSALVGWPCKPGAIWGRLNALELLAVCGRCLGSGKHSWNATDGDRCFGCRGSGKRLPKLTVKLATEVREREARGELVEYYAKIERIRSATAAIRVLGPAIDFAWRNHEAHAVFASFDRMTVLTSFVVTSRFFAEVGRVNKLWETANTIRRAAKRGEIDACETAEQLSAILADLRADVAPETLTLAPAA